MSQFVCEFVRLFVNLWFIELHAQLKMDHPNLHTYLGEELLLNQFTQLAANVCDALTPGPAASAIDRQILNLIKKTKYDQVS